MRNTSPKQKTSRKDWNNAEYVSKIKNQSQGLVLRKNPTKGIWAGALAPLWAEQPRNTSPKQKTSRKDWNNADYADFAALVRQTCHKFTQGRKLGVKISLVRFLLGG